ncbi:MAG TPA: hypothetical protein VG347_22030 [Verrucomicrobiae bacterium]|nr:hypothetical protein [Verrucomicrobiae bacterium]
MADRAKISSVDALEAFRARLIVFLGQARPVLDEVSGEMSRTRLWLQNEQRSFWELELRRRERKLEEAKQELFSARMSAIPTGTAALLQMTVQRCQRAIQEAEAKLKILRRWENELDNRAAPLLKQVDQLRGFLASDMAQAVAYMDRALTALDAYHNIAPAPAPASTPEPTAAEGKA